MKNGLRTFSMTIKSKEANKKCWLLLSLLNIEYLTKVAKMVRRVFKSFKNKVIIPKLKHFLIIKKYILASFSFRYLDENCLHYIALKMWHVEKANPTER